MQKDRKEGCFLKKINPILVLLILAIVTAAIDGTMAYLMKRGIIENEFMLGTTNTRIEETFNDEKTEKLDVYFVNDGNTEVYVRAKVMVYYENAEEEIIDVLPVENTDYKMEWGENFLTDWFEDGGYYYYKKPLKEKEQTGMLIESCKDLLPEDEKYLVVDVVTQSIQAAPADAVKEAWSVKVDEKTGMLVSAVI